MRTIVPESTGAGFVLSNDVARMIVVGSPPGLPKHFDVIDMDHPTRVSSFDLFREGLGPVHWFFSLPPTGGKYFVLEVIGTNRKPLVWLPLVEDVRNLKEVPGSWDLCRFSNLSGDQGWSKPNTDQLRLFQFDDGRLTFHEGGKEVTMTDWFLPKEHRFPQTTWILMAVNNTDILALSGAEFDGGAPDLSSHIFSVLVLDKKTNQWSTFKIVGEYELRGFGNEWIAAVIQNSVKPKPEPEARGGNNLPPKPPGFDRFMKGRNLRRPGIIYLYNGHTHQRLVINTKQPDSEVILIEDDEIYYRVKQVVWRAKIMPHGLSRPELVADDPAIVDAHWAFWGPTEVPPK